MSGTANPATRRPAPPATGFGIDVDVATTLVTAAVAVSLARAFRTWSPLWTLLLVVVLAHGYGILARRLRLSATVAVLTSLVLGVVVVTILHYRGLSWFGIPNPSVVSQAAEDIRTAYGPFQKLVPPVDDARGFTVTIALGLWLMATFADLAVGRADAPAQAVASHVATFVFSSVLLLGRHAVLATVVFVASLALYRIAVRAGRVRVAAGRPRGPASVWAAGIPVMAVVLLGGVLASQAVTTDDEGLVDLRSIGRGPKARVVESPLVSLDALLGDRSNEILFSVRSKEPHYWRLTALDDYDGRSWSASATYRDLDDGESIDPRWGDSLEVSREQMQVTLSALTSDWLPTAFAPVAVDAPVDLRYDDGSGSVFVADGESTEDITYRVAAEVPDVQASDFESAVPARGKSFADYLALPSNFPDRATQLALSITAGNSPFAAATALEQFFRSDRFVYDREANYRGSTDPLMDFIDRGNGFCQQFATAFAALARASGIPARVAVGFTYGSRASVTDPTTGEETNRWTVRGRYAHAWPEVYIVGAGWVAFEPTPGRGNPDAAGYSTAEPSQADGSGGVETMEQTLATTTTTTLPAGVSAPPTTEPDRLPQPLPEQADTSGSASSSTPVRVLLGIIAFAALLAGLFTLRKRAVHQRRERPRTTTVDPGERISVTWAQACRDLERVDVRANPAETPLEFARRASRIVEVEDVVALGRHESHRRFRRRPPDVTEAEDAERIGDEIREVVWSRLDRRQRMAADLDW